MKTAPVFEMRGLCYGTSFDRHFGWTGVWDPDTEQYSFPGFSKSMLKVDSFNKFLLFTILKIWNKSSSLPPYH